ncbi:indolepyruvate ferredoxin oxidoreductase [Paramagnetospirillum marisnigri]|uniref:Indolepyruvate ferredoxin oxidoreductase n=1 Tax=Paramagnetospirillum marisnigri TaxID=1285242 RepID=A0A178MZR1_9PROT|nr:indolepyruvate ferredoxin oxidoreductase family protein [Paramagnetospirillum marisnigri]OAN56051.1 indolepyruvate ferredoxin oxidoreductase [Paramagnetospirillum marisnigri]
MTFTRTVTLDDKYVQDQGRVYLSGIQSLVRLPMIQRLRDKAAGLNTGGFVSGYRGSPLGGLDKELWRAEKFLAAHDIRFQPGLNEDLAATAVWGTQQIGLFPQPSKDGVFALWYGKGPGLDRSVDVFKHGNSAGTAPHGGVLVLAGDDHGAKSSTLAHQSEHVFMAAQMPVLNPAGVQELMDFGLFGWALSRFSGLWVGMKAISETVESSASVLVDPWRQQFDSPVDFEMPPGGLSIRWPHKFLEQEMLLMRHRIPAALAFARTNRIDRLVINSPQPRFGIVTVGKSHLEVLQALADLGIDEAHAAEIGIRLYKVGMSWPLEQTGIRAFAEGLDEILVVEEKRSVVEEQLKAQLYNWREDVRPRVVGEFDEAGAWTLPAAGELTPAQIARVIAARIGRFYTSLRVKERLDWLDAKERQLAAVPQGFSRIPYFCAGCPHNTSTHVPEGSQAMAGIGCHFMATWMDRETLTYTHMGGEGATWIGQAPFTTRAHMFQNLGDGTYTHSGSLAIRAALAAKVNITYKILFNDAVAMTGGQPAEGALSVPMIAAQVRAEGVGRIAVVSDDPGKYPADAGFPAAVSFHHRDDLDAVQRELREVKGVSVLIYDQTCAAEKRRRRKRGLMPDPAERVVINEKVCEGCGDCGVQSNCVAVVPVETEWGRKRAIDQSSCNKDFSCVKGFCPSFVSVRGGAIRRNAEADEPDTAPLPEPVLPAADKPFGIVVTGIGGTGVVTVAEVLGMAAHLEGKGVTSLDQTGLAQKNGAVMSHVRICDDPDKLHAVRIAAGQARLLLACDMVVAAGFETLSKLKPGQSMAVVNDHQSMPATFTHAPDLDFPGRGMHDTIREQVGGDVDFLDASRLATTLLGDALATNMFLVGYAWQKGGIPLTEAAILRAIDLNGAKVEFNRRAFRWGRRAAVDLAEIERLAAPPVDRSDHRRLSESLDELIRRRVEHLTAYQDVTLAERYYKRISRVRKAERRAAPASESLTEAAARSLAKLMSYKDEYEVARLYSDGSFLASLKEQFDSWERLELHLAPPLLGGGKRRFGPWVLQLMPLLARLKGLRGTPFDLFGYTAERRQERALIGEFTQILDELAQGLTPDNHRLAVDIASLPRQIRGFGPVKAKAAAEYHARLAQLMTAFRSTEVKSAD